MTAATPPPPPPPPPAAPVDGDHTVLALLDALVRTESVNPALDPTGAGEGPVAALVADWARGHGLRVEVLDADPARPDVLVRGGRARGGGRLLLCGHLDTVGLAGSHDGTTPRIEGDRLYGRGAYDMKAGLAAALDACRRADAAGIDGEVVVAAVADEEHASRGVQAVLDNLDAATVDAAVVCEPTERHVGTAHRGFVWTEVTVTGVAAHGSRPHLGADAILAAGRLLMGFEELDQRLRAAPHPFVGPGSLHGSLVEGGTEPSTIPDRCTFTIERRTVPGETLADVERDVADVVTRWRPDDDRVGVATRTVLHRAPMMTPRGAEVTTALLTAAGDGTEAVPMSYWADSAFLSAAGIPTVLFGPEGEGAHADVEWVSRSGTVETAAVLTRLAHALAG